MNDDDLAMRLALSIAISEMEKAAASMLKAATGLRGLIADIDRLPKPTIEQAALRAGREAVVGQKDSSAAFWMEDIAAARAELQRVEQIQRLEQIAAAQVPGSASAGKGLISPPSTPVAAASNHVSWDERMTGTVGVRWPPNTPTASATTMVFVRDTLDGLGNRPGKVDILLD